MINSSYPMKLKKEFDYDKIEPKTATEPPTPTSDDAINHVPNPCTYSNLSHEKIMEIRNKATNIGKHQYDWTQSHDLYPESFPHFVISRDSVRSHIAELFKSRIGMHDGAMGTMIQNYEKKHKLGEEEFRGEEFKDWYCNVKGNNDMLSITQPHVIRDIHLEHLEKGGSDFIGTSAFSSTTIAMADYEMEEHVHELNYSSARIARETCDIFIAKDHAKPRFVLGAIGPTNRMASISPSVEDASYRNVTFDELVEAYFEQIVVLVDGGSDILIVETTFDTLNAKCALCAITEYLEITGLDIPVFVLGTLVDQSGRTLSGQTGEAIFSSIIATF